MESQQEIIDKLIDHIDTAILKNSVSNRQVASVLAFLNEELKNKKVDIDIESLKKYFISRTEPDTANGYIKFPAGISVKGVDISDSLSLWKKKQDPDGNSYLYTDLPIVTRIGLITYNDDGTINLPNLYDGIPLDGTTIGRDASGALTVLGGVGSDFDAAQMWAALSGSGAEQINKSHLTDALAGYARTSDIPSLTGYATESWVNDKGYVTTTRLNELIGGASSAFDTLKEIEDYINSHESVTAGLIASLGNKVDKVTGMGLSEHSFTTTLREKLNSIAEGANKYILPVAKAAVLGGVMIGSNINVNAQGLISVAAPYSHPTQQVITTGAARHFLTGLAVNEYGHVTSATSAALTKDDLLSVLKDEDGVIRLDAQLALTGSLINFANLETVNIPSLYDGIPVDGKSIYWENGTLKSSSTGGGGLAKVIVKVGLAAYESVDGVVTLPAYPTMPDLSGYVTTNTNQDIWSQKNFKYGFGIGSGSFGNNGFFEGTGDGATFDWYNFYLKGWFGMAFKDYADNVTGIYNFRNGLLTLNGGFAKRGGTSNQFLKADGSVDSNSYLLSTGGILTGTTEIRGGQLKVGQYTDGIAVLDALAGYAWFGFNGYTNGIRISREGELQTAAGNKFWHSGNGGIGSGMNADLLDGRHLTEIMAIKGNIVSHTNWDDLLEIGTYLNTSGNGIGNSNSKYQYSVDLVFGGYNYITQLQCANAARGLAIRQKWDNNWSPWRNIAFEDGNVASATVLQTARSIWGQPFKGDSNIEGPMYGVRSVNSLQELPIDYFSQQGQYFYTEKDKSLPILTLRDNVGIGIVTPMHKLHVHGDTYSTGAVGSESGFYIVQTGLDYCGLQPNYRITSSGDPKDIWLYNLTRINYGANEHLFRGGNVRFSNKIIVDMSRFSESAIPSISLAIGDTDTGFDWVSDGAFNIKSNNVDIATINTDGIAANKRIYTTAFMNADQYVSAGRIYTGFDSGVAGSVSSGNWFYSSGNTGWFNHTYGGGIYMADGDQVRVYNNKVLYNDGYRTWGIAGHRVGLKLYNPLHTGINLSNDSYTWGIYSHWNGNMYIGRRSGNVNDESGEYYLIIGAGTMTYNGSIVLNGGGLITYSSDIRLKEIQEYFKPSLNELAALPIFAHSWRNGTPGVQLSTSAQDVQKIMPWNVFEGDDGYLKMDGTRTALAVSIRLAQLANEYITENDRWKSDKDRQIEALQREVQSLKKQLNAA